MQAPNLPIIVSFSGGRTSAYMLRLLLDNYPDADLRVVFANTGKERPETLDFVQACSQRFAVPVTWVEAVVTPEKGTATGYRVVDYATASRQGEPFEDVIAKYGIPNNSFPHCSRELKTQPIGAWIKDQFPNGAPFQMALGIRADEAHREGAWWYPLIEWGVTKAQVRQFWREQPFDLGLKDYEGNCDLCWKKGHNKNLTLLEERPELGTWWAAMEAKYGHVSPSDADRRQTKKTAALPLLDTLQGVPNKKAGPFYFNHNALSMAAMREIVRRKKFRRIKDNEDVRSCACGVEFENLMPHA
jgi:hypothetical protein